MAHHNKKTETDTLPGLLTEEVMDLFQINSNTLRLWTDQGWINKTKIGPGLHRNIYMFEEIKRVLIERIDLTVRVSKENYIKYAGQPKPQFWTTVELADSLYVDRRTVLDWVKKKKLIPLGKHHVYLFNAESLIRFKTENTKTAQGYIQIIDALIQEAQTIAAQ